MTDPYANAHSAELERAVLSVLFDGRSKTAAGDFLELLPKPEAFWVRDHQVVAKTIGMMIARGDRIEAIAIHDALRQIRFADAMGEKGRDNPWRFEEGVDLNDRQFAAIGYEKLFEIGAGNGSQSGFRKNCELIADHYVQRQMIQTLTVSLENASAVDGRTKLMLVADHAINDISQIMGGAAVSATMDEAMSVVLRMHDVAQVTKESRLPSWGIPSLDRKIPMGPGRMYVLAAAPGCGKTSLALQSAQQTMATLGESSVAIINLEMPAEQLARILIARTIKVPTRLIENGWLKPEQRQAAADVQRAWAGTNLGVKGSAGKCTVEDTCSWIRQRYLRSHGRLRLVVIDYLQLIERSHQRQMEYDVLSLASKSIKRLALELNLQVLVLSALSREGRKAIRNARTGALQANPEPRKEDLRGCGSIEGDADGIVFIWSEAVDPTDSLPVHLKIDKNRFGREGTTDAMFDKANGQVFVDMVSPTVTEDPADSNRKHHAHPPEATEDVWGDTQAAGAIP